MISTWDSSIVQSLASTRTPLGIDFFASVTNLSGAIVCILVLLGAFLILERSNRWPYGAGMIISIIFSFVVSEIIRNIVQRPRPPLSLHALYEVGYSFPSNHAALAVAMYGFLVYALWKSASHDARYFFAGLCIAIIITVGYSRVYLGVHYPSDIIAGYLVGFIGAWLGTRLSRRLLRFAK